MGEGINDPILGEGTGDGGFDTGVGLKAHSPNMADESIFVCLTALALMTFFRYFAFENLHQASLFTAHLKPSVIWIDENSPDDIFS